MDTPAASPFFPSSPAPAPLTPAPTPVVQEPKSSKGAIAAIVIVLLLVGGYLAWAMTSDSWPFASVASDSPSASIVPVTGTKIYRNEVYGFEVSYPAAYYLLTDLVVDAESGQFDFDAATRALNRGLSYEDSSDLGIHIIAFGDLPKTDLQACNEVQETLNANGECSGPANPSQEYFRKSRQAILSAKVGANFDGGKVVLLPSGERGIRYTDYSPQSGEYSARFVLFDKANNRIEFDIRLHGVTTDVAAKADSRNAVLDQVLSTFSFTNQTAGWKTYRINEGEIAFKYPMLVTDYLPIPNDVNGELANLSFNAGGQLIVASKLNNPGVLASGSALISVGGNPMRERQYTSSQEDCHGMLVQGVVHGKNIYITYDNCFVGQTAEDAGFPTQTQIALFHQILSTFKFTTPVDTSTWKTYTNTTHGFEFKYPNSYKTVLPPEEQEGWPEGIVLLILSNGYAQSYDLAVEVWDTETAFQEKYRTAPDIVQKVGSKFITAWNINKSSEIDKILSTFKFTK